MGAECALGMVVRETVLNTLHLGEQPARSFCASRQPLTEGFFRSEGGTVKAARLPKGWTGPVSMLGTRGGVTPAPCYFLRLPFRVDHINQLPQAANRVTVEAKRQSWQLR